MESRGEAGRAQLPDPPEPSLLAYNGPLIRAEALIYALAQAEIKSSLVGAWLIVDTQRAGPGRDLSQEGQGRGEDTRCPARVKAANL